jgi:hypothetical protein
MRAQLDSRDLRQCAAELSDGGTASGHDYDIFHVNLRDFSWREASGLSRRRPALGWSKGNATVTLPARLAGAPAAGMTSGSNAGAGGAPGWRASVLQSSKSWICPVGKRSILVFGFGRHLSEINLISLFTENNRCLRLCQKIEYGLMQGAWRSKRRGKRR